jgi:alkylation response protein AidB-like acyl-CoA dehydrogenase
MATTNVLSARHDVDHAAEPKPAAGEAARLLTAVRNLAPELAARAEEIEAARRVPGDIIDTLRRIGIYRMLVPQSHRGLELSVPDVVPVLEALAAAESSVGWVAMIGVTSQIMGTRAPRATYDRVYADGPDAVVVGVGTPAGRAEQIEGGYRITGRWPFASGCQNAQWIVGHFMVTKNGEPVMSGGLPLSRFVMLPAERWRIDETWRASGLTGSGSHHVILKDVEVTEASTFDPLHGASCIPGPFESVVTPFISIFHAAVAVGIASGAVADLVAMAGAGRRQLFAAADLRDSPVFQHRFGQIGAELRAARALLEVQAANHWRRAVEGTLDGKADFAESLQSSAWIHATCTEIVGGCYTLGGSSAVLNESPLQRRLRDVHATRQHVFAQERFYASAGAHQLGFPPVDPFFGR